MMHMVLEAGSLPWENCTPAATDHELMMQEKCLKPLGHAKAIVLGLLQRDPAKRLTMAQCVAACQGLVEDCTCAAAVA